MVISGPGSRLIFSQPSVLSFFVRLLVGYLIKTQMNTQMYAFALRKTTVYHISGCVVKILYPTLPRFQSKMAIVWDRSIIANCHDATLDLWVLCDVTVPSSRKEHSAAPSRNTTHRRLYTDGRRQGRILSSF